MVDALTRIRVLRRDGYRCMVRTPARGVCGAPAPVVGPHEGQLIAMCTVHGPAAGVPQR